MKFIKKEDNVKLECGDFVFFGGNELAMVIKDNDRYKILYLCDGVCSTMLDFDNLEDFQSAIDEDFKNAKIIKSKNVVITEV